MTTINLNQSPYFDDFLEGKKFYQILFRPGRAVQARELNQMQTLLKSQIERLGKYIFENGSIVLPGNGEGLKYSNNVPFIKLPASLSSFTDTEANLQTYWMDKVVVSSSGSLGIRAKVIGYRAADSLNQVRLYLSYLNADTSSGTASTFSQNQSISTEESAPILAQIVDSQYATGTVASVTVQEAVYFYNGRFVLVDNQTVFLTPPASLINTDSAWNNKPSASIGLEFIESVVSWTQDEDLLDNANGTPNLGAPGADRLHISANLIQLELNETGSTQDYVELVKVIDGDVQKRVVKSELSELEDVLAGRTFDESGDYTVIPFQVQIKEFLRDATNNGAHVESEFLYLSEAEAKAASVSIFGLTEPGSAWAHPTQLGKWVPGTSYDQVNDPTSFVQMCEDRLSVVIDPGKAYVKGYGIEKISTSIVDFKKARSTKFRNNKYITTPLGTYIYVKNVYGALQSNTYDTIDLYDTPIVTKGIVSGTKIGAARVLAIEFFSGFYDPQSPSSDNRVYRMFMFDIQMIGDNKFEQVKSIYSTNPTFTCDAVLERYRLNGAVSKATRKVTLTGTTTNASKSITGLSSTTNLRPGMFVSGSGIPSTYSVTITSIDSATAITISANATASASVSLTFISELSSQVGRDEQTLVGVGTAWRNDQSQLLRKNDYIEIDAGQSTSKIYKVESNPSSDTILRVTSNISADSWVDGAKIDYLYTPLRSDSTNAGLVYSLPDSPVATIRGATASGGIDTTSIDTVYTVRRVDTGKTATLVSGSLYKLSLTADTGTEFEDFTTSTYSVIITEHTATPAKAGTWLQVLPYSATTPTARTAFVRPLGNQLEIYFHVDDANTAKFQIESTIVKPGGAVSAERPKTLVKGSFSGGTYQGDGWVVSSGGDVNVISLGKPDVLRITRIVESQSYSDVPSSAETLPSNNTDITGLYILDNGQRDHYYDIASVSLRPGAKRPRGRVRVEFDYFTHTGTGDYFSVNSYPFVGGTQLTQTMKYADIPDFVASDGTRYDLASAIDFRPVVNTGGISAGFATVMGVPKENLRCDYHFYEGRKDKLFLDKDKQFYIKSGVPDINPITPDDPDSGMVIYELNIAPYTYSTDSVFSKMRDNKRYTMRDIGKLEKRISNLEYYTTLSLLEKDTNTLLIKDAQGNDRFKNGFLVDNFKTFGASDLGSLDYRCSLDRTEGTLRPIIQEDSVGLFEKVLLLSTTNAISQERVAKGYQKTGELFTLPYTKASMLQQLKASRTLNVNPYAVFAYVGSVSITPWSDEWRETTDADPLNVKDQGAWESAKQSFGPTGTRVDYQTTVNNWISSSTETELTGREIVEQAGHTITDQSSAQTGRSKKKIKRDGLVKVPSGYGYANEGSFVPVGRKSLVSQETRTTTTLQGKEITTQFTSTFVDQGWSNPVSMGSRIIDTSMIEYMRSREITFTGKAFMPRVRLYPFFDGVDVSAYCRPKTSSTLGTPLVCDEKGRIEGVFVIPNNTNVKFKTGDRMFRLTTSSVNIQSPPPDSAGEARYTARGWIDTKQETTYSTRMFGVENGSTQSTKDISLVTSSVLGKTDATPRDPIAQSFYVYDTGGCFITDIDVFFATKPAEYVSGVVNKDQPPVLLQVRELGDQGLPSDRILPFGEVVLEAGEVVINQIDVNAGTLLVTGYKGSDPTKIVSRGQITGPWTNGEYVPGGQVSNGTPFSYGADPQPHMVPTRFTFESPIYLAQGKNYAFVLIANSIEYNVWVAQSGPDTSVADPNDQSNNVEIGTSREIMEDPYFQGVVFKSQNGISWNADQTMDMKFKIWKAQFDITAKGEVEFVNDELPLKNLSLDPFEIVSGSGYVRVIHINHGHTTVRTGTATGAASKVVFTPTFDVTLNGVTSTTTTVTTTGNFNSIVVGSFIQNPATGERRRVASKSVSTLTLDNKFDAGEMVGANNVKATSYAVPSGTTLGGIHADYLFDFRGFDVEYTELDGYRINVGSGTGKTATATGRFGGNQVYVSENKRFEEMTLLTTPLVTPETNILWNVQTTSGCGVHDSVSSTFIVQPLQNFSPNDKIVFNNPMLIGSFINELPPAGSPYTVGGPSTVASNSYGDRKSLTVRAVLKSTNPNISPVIDESRMTAYLVNHRLDDPRGIVGDWDSAQVINAAVDNYVCVPTTVTPAVSTTGPNKIWFSTSSSTATGTVTGVAGSRTLTGSGTKFLSEIVAGDSVKTPNNEERTVVSVVSDTELLLNLAIGSGAGFTGSLYITPPYLNIKTADASIAKHFSNLDVGKYLSVTNATGTRNFSDVRVLDVNYTPNNTVTDTNLSNPSLCDITVEYRCIQAAGFESNTNVTFTQKDRFIDEIAPEGGSCGSKYVSKKLAVSRASNGLKITFDASRHESCDIEVYYKIELANANQNWDDVNWTKAEFTTDFGGVLVASTPAPNESSSSFSEYEVTVNALPAFTAAQAKIVMRGGNPARSPRIKNFRMIVLDE